MGNVVFFNTYTLKDGASIPDFLLAVEQLNNEYISKQKGYVSFELLQEGETWADSTTFETLEDLQAFENSGTPSEHAERFYSFLNISSCKSRVFTSIRSFNNK